MKKKSYDKRARRLARFSALFGLLFSLILLLANLMMDSFLGRSMSWDLSSNQLMHIGAISQSILRNLEDKLELTVLSTEEDYRLAYPFMPQLLEDYVTQSGGKLSLRYRDPDLYPNVLTELDPESQMNYGKGKLVLRNSSNQRQRSLGASQLFDYKTDDENQTQIASINAEAAISGAIKYLTAPEIKKVYRLSGLGEDDFSNRYRYFSAVFDNNGYPIEDLNMNSSLSIPEDAALLLLIDPKRDLSELEAEKMASYIRKGGRLWVAVAYNQDTFPRLNQLLSSFDLALTNNRIQEKDTSAQVSELPYSILASVPVTSLTTEAVERATLLIQAREIKTLNLNPDIEKEKILVSSQEAVSEEAGNPLRLSPAEQKALAIAAKRPAGSDTVTLQINPEAKLLLVATPSAFSDDTLKLYGRGSHNLQFVYQMSQWLLEDSQSSRLLIAPKIPTSYSLAVNQSTPVYLSAVVAFLLFPLFFLSMAFRIYRKRKHL